MHNEDAACVVGIVAAFSAHFQAQSCVCCWDRRCILLTCNTKTLSVLLGWLLQSTQHRATAASSCHSSGAAPRVSTPRSYPPPLAVRESPAPGVTAAPLIPKHWYVPCGVATPTTPTIELWPQAETARSHATARCLSTSPMPHTAPALLLAPARRPFLPAQHRRWRHFLLCLGLRPCACASDQGRARRGRPRE